MNNMNVSKPCATIQHKRVSSLKRHLWVDTRISNCVPNSKWTLCPIPPVSQTYPLSLNEEISKLDYLLLCSHTLWNCTDTIVENSTGLIRYFQEYQVHLTVEGKSDGFLYISMCFETLKLNFNSCVLFIWFTSFLILQTFWTDMYRKPLYRLDYFFKCLLLNFLFIWECLQNKCF